MSDHPADIRVLGCGVVPSEVQTVRESMVQHADIKVFSFAMASCAGLVPPGMARRIGRLQKMAIAAARLAMQEAPAPPADPANVAVCVGTGLGSQTETAEFVENMIRLGEAEPKPARFVNSVHNSIASQLAIAWGFSGENHTFTHQSISFDLALWQAVQLLRTGRAERVLACGADELSPYLLSVASSRRRWRGKVSTPLVKTYAKGIPGEGCAAFVLARCDASYGAPRVAALHVAPLNARNAPAVDRLRELEFVGSALGRAGRGIRDVDFVLTCDNGDSDEDSAYVEVLNALSAAAGHPLRTGRFKQFCGDFYTASAIGFAAAVRMVQEKRVPPEIAAAAPCQADPGSPVRNVLLYNLSRTGHSVCLITE